MKIAIDYDQLVTAQDRIDAETAAETERAIAESTSYLAKTDWYLLRLMETGKPVPPDVLESRAAARTEASDTLVRSAKIPTKLRPALKS